MAQGPRRGSSDDKSKRPPSGSSRPSSSGRPSSGKPSGSGSRSGGSSYSGRSGPGNDRRPTGGGYRDDRGDRPYGDRPQGDRPDRGDRPYGDRPQRSYGDRPQGDRPQRSYGDRPQGDRPDRGDRPYGDRPQRSYGDRPQGDRPDRGDRPYGDRPQRSYGDRPQGDRPQRSYGDRPQGDRPDRGDRPYGDRPQRSYGDRPQGDRPQRSYGDRPQGDRPDRGDRSYGDRPPRSYGDRPQGDRPQRSYVDRPQGDRPSRGYGAAAAAGAAAGRQGGRGGYRDDRGGYRDDRRSSQGRMDRPSRPTGPAIPDDVTGSELDQSIRGDLRTLSLEAATLVSQHLVMAERTLSDNPELAWEHAKAAVSRGGRLAVVREAAGVSAYAAGHYADALAQFRAARRISGSDAYWPVMADCERGLGRPERAITMAGAPEADRLDREGRLELRIVASGARRDLGQIDAALVTLQCPELSSDEVTSWSARIKFAYADTLVEAGRSEEAREWFVKASEVDVNDETEAAERIAEMDGIVWVDLVDEEGDEVDGVLVDGENVINVDFHEADDEDDISDEDEFDDEDDDEFEEDESDDEDDEEIVELISDLADVQSSTISEADALLEKLEAEALALERAAAEALAAVTAARAALDSRANHDSEDSSSD